MASLHQEKNPKGGKPEDVAVTAQATLAFPKTLVGMLGCRSTSSTCKSHKRNTSAMFSQKDNALFPGLY